MAHKKSICGIVFDLAAPYNPGPCDLTAAEASTLNQTRAENIGNNLREKIAEQVAGQPVTELSAETLATIHAMVADFDATYAFGVNGGPRGPRGPSDPVKNVALGMSEADIRGAVLTQGKPPQTAKWYTEKAKERFEKNEAHYRAKAEAAMRKAGKDETLLSDLGL